MTVTVAKTKTPTKGAGKATTKPAAKPTPERVAEALLTERTVTLTERYSDKRTRLAALHAMSPAERLDTYRAGGFSFNDCCMWAAHYRLEVPILQGEFEFIAVTMPEFCE